MNGQQVTASLAGVQPLAHVPIGGSGWGVEIGATLVTIQPDISPYATQPTSDPQQPQNEPQFTDVFNPQLAGTLNVSSNGAATYTLPIAIPPGIAGMAPNLSLVYNSQGGDGIAGQGWELAGLSAIYRCAKTKVQDGASAPVTGGTFDDTNGVCLDGKRLFTQGGWTYKAEQQDFSRISVSQDGQTFTVVS